MIAVAARTGVRADLGRLAAFMRRDWLVLLSYRAAVVGDLLSLSANLLLFGLIGRLVDPAALPTYGGTHVGYLEFVALGSAMAMLTGLMLSRVATGIRNEQLIGTLEALMLTPTRMAVLQAGTVAFDAVLVPVRLTVFLGSVWLVLGLDLHTSGILPSVAVLAAYLPFVWGVGLLSAGAILTFRRGNGIVMFAVSGLGLVSGAYFPLSVLPGWVADLARWNPMAIGIDELREAMIGGVGWDALGADTAVLAAASAVALLVGTVAFRAALARERRLGTLGLY